MSPEDRELYTRMLNHLADATSATREMTEAVYSLPGRISFHAAPQPAQEARVHRSDLAIVATIAGFVGAAVALVTACR